MAFNKVIITLFSLLLSGVLLSLNFLTVNSIEAGQSDVLEKESGKQVELKAASEENIWKYTSSSPEVQLDTKSFDLVSRGEPRPQQANFGFAKIGAVLEGDTLILETSGRRAVAEPAAVPTLQAAAEFGEDFSIRQDLYLDDPALHRPGEDTAAQPADIEDVALVAAEVAAIPVIEIQYDRDGNYDARKTWAGIELPNLLARAMLAEENEKLFDPERVPDFIGAGWVMVNRTQKDDFFDYADDNLYGALVPYFQFALGGVLDETGRVLPGNAAIVANPSAYPSWFGGRPEDSYWQAYQIALGILLQAIPDPTGGALYFADFYINDAGESVPFEDGRTRFWHQGYPSFSIPELERIGSAPWSTN